MIQVRGYQAREELMMAGQALFAPVLRGWHQKESIRCLFEVEFGPGMSACQLQYIRSLYVVRLLEGSLRSIVRVSIVLPIRPLQWRNNCSSLYGSVKVINKVSTFWNFWWH